MKRIVIICQGRTGSTNLSDFYKKKYNIKNMGEVFRNLEYKKDPNKLVLDLNNKPNWIVKLVPIQMLDAAVNEFLAIGGPGKTFNDKIRTRQYLEDYLQYRTESKFYKKNKKEITNIIINLCIKIIALADKHVYLYRKDIHSQVKSLTIASRTKEFGPYRAKEKAAVFSEELRQTFNSLKQTYELIKEVYSVVPGELLALEDFDFDIGKKYNSITLVGDKHHLEEYNVEVEVFGIQKARG
jgi:hypothetical protein